MKQITTLIGLLLLISTTYSQSVTVAVVGTTVNITMKANVGDYLPDNDSVRVRTALEAASITKNIIQTIKLISAPQNPPANAFFTIKSCRAVSSYFLASQTPLLTTLDLSGASFSGNITPDYSLSGGGAFYAMNFTDVILPAGIIALGARTFMNCNKLSSITLPNTFNEFRAASLFGCASLKKIVFNGSTVPTLTGGHVLTNVNLNEVVIPQNANKSAFASALDIPESIISFSYFQNASYYVSTQGDDNNSGTSESSPWKSIAKINASMSALQEGDSILFRRGEIFYGSLLITQSNLYVGGYGEGENPILSGAKVISSGWTNHAAGIWVNQLTTGNAPERITNMYMDNSVLPLGRHPNLDSPEKGYYKYESSESNIKIRDNELTGSINWTGAEIVVKVYLYRFSKTKVTNHSGNELTLAPGLEVGGNLNPGYGYFFSNDLRTLDQEGEWAYDASQKKVYLYSQSNPNGNEISYAFEDNVITVSGATGVGISGLDIVQGNSSNVFFLNTSNVSIENSSLKAAGTMGLYIQRSSYAQVKNCFFKENNLRALYIRVACSNITVTNNVFEDIGTNAAYGEEKGLYCIYNESSGSHFISNHFENIGGGAIISGGANQLIKKNRIKNALTLLDDMGAIYVNNDLGDLTGTVIEENMVSNCYGEYWSTPRTTGFVHGIYLDNFSSNVTVRNNTVFNIDGSCYYMHRLTNNTTFTGNTALNGVSSEVYMYNMMADAKIFFDNNILVSTVDNPKHNSLNYDSRHTHFDLSGTYSNNHLIRPKRDEKIRLKTYETSGATTDRQFSAYQFESIRPNFINTHPSPFMIDSANILFYYNDTETDTIIQLNVNSVYVDVYGNTHCQNVILNPFCSIVLFKCDLISCNPIQTPNAPQNLRINQFSEASAELNWDIVAESINYDVRYKLQEDSSWKYANNVLENKFTIENLITNKIYSVQVRASVIGGDSNWSSLISFTAETNAILSDLIQVYPNPVKDHLVIRTSQMVQEVRIIDVSSRILYHQFQIQSTEHLIPTNRWPNGIYLVYIATKNDTYLYKICKITV